ncbi:hypothetical protein [Noviherbaspirillum malthae]|uniref:hypothetical protein n=1 Tax=Noviherbaspirillum malthae TaxID=1260987 RepID=UPI00188FDEDC|nr:hypothetical protein [Noviherbaspirillum malthae]
MKSRLLVLAFAGSIACLTTPAILHAKTVFDPTNFVMNAMEAGRTAVSEVSAATTAIQKVRQTIELIRATTSIDGLARMAGLEEELGLYQELVAVDNQLAGAINLSKSMYQDLNAQFGASNFSREAFMQGRSAIDTYRAQAFIDKYESVNRSMAAMNARRSQILAKVEGNASITSATQGLGAQVDMLISQNQQMISMLNMKAGDKAAAMSRDQISREAALREYARKDKVLRDAGNAFK